MKNIFLVFIQDLKRISTNVVAIVVLIGLTVIPPCMRGLTLCQTGTHTEQIPLPASKLLWRLMIRV